MTKVLHISTECYPAAKAGGMGDVVGALPIYLPQVGVDASVIIPHYNNKWIQEHSFEKMHSGNFQMGSSRIAFSINKLVSKDVDFPLYTVDIPGKFDRASIYLNHDGNAYPDEVERNISFQRSILEWLSNGCEFDILHCHDHMTGLIPFMIKFCNRYKSLDSVKTFFTIHNGQYRGAFGWPYAVLLPDFDVKDGGLLEWDGRINSLATAIKCTGGLNTVSPSYMQELQSDFDNLTGLMRSESYKSVGILNGIDDELWDPGKDPMLEHHLKKNLNQFKTKNKEVLVNQFGFNPNLPLVSFIGRFAYEKGADLLVPSFDFFLRENKNVQFLILGSGDKAIEYGMVSLQNKYPKLVTAVIAYNESLAHKIYAGSDYIIMPSRFEPCGLNQMYAMRYGTIPIVRDTGGLKDTVPDIGDGGNGISFRQANGMDIVHSLNRAAELYAQKDIFGALRSKIISLDFGWKLSAKLYADQYNKL